MPFSDAQFAAAWTVLEDRFNRKHNSQTVLIYRELLEADLTAVEFSDACRAAFRVESFFPSPQKLIDLGRKELDFDTLALEAWDACLTRFLAGEPTTQAGTLERELMNSVTLGAGLGAYKTDRLPWMRREFLERYAARLSAARTAVLAARAAARTAALAAPAQELPNVAN